MTLGMSGIEKTRLRGSDYFWGASCARLRGRYETVPSLTGLNHISHLTRHSAFGCVPGYDYSVPAALDFAVLVLPIPERKVFRNRDSEASQFPFECKDGRL